MGRLDELDKIKVRTPIRWAGSKKKLVKRLESLCPDEFNTYIEPFCGSLCLLLQIQPDKAVVGDINGDLIDFYMVMKDHHEAVGRAIHEMPQDEEFYYYLRDADWPVRSPVDRAAKFLYLNRFCFNGVYRTNLKGKFNVPRGRHMGSLPTQEELSAFGAFIKRVDFFCLDFSVLLEKARADDFIYLDPPYAGRNVRNRGEYGAGAFQACDIDRMVETLRSASRKGVKVMLSYADIPEIREHFKAWSVVELEVGRNVSGFCKGRKKVSELVIRNY